MPARKKVSTKTYMKMPEFSKIRKSTRDFEKKFNNALHYAHYELSTKNQKEETIQWAKSLGKDHKKYQELPDYEFITLGKICYIINRGGDITDDAKKFIKKRETELFADEEESEDTASLVTEKPQKPKLTKEQTQQKMIDGLNEICGEFEYWIDKFVQSNDPKEKFDNPYSALKQFNIKPSQSKHFIDAFTPMLDEYNLLVKNDKELKEGYKGLSRDKIKKIRDFYQAIINGAEAIKGEKKSEVKKKVQIRRKKPVSLVKIVEKLKFKKTDGVLGISSVSPIDIIGARELYVYNTKYQRLGYYMSNDDDGFGIKGTTLQNISPASFEKTCKPEGLKEFKSLTKAKMRKYIQDSKYTSKKLTGRINENIVLLKLHK